MLSPANKKSSKITTNSFSAKREDEILKEVKDALENGKRYNSAKEMHDEILNSR